MKLKTTCNDVRRTAIKRNALASVVYHAQKLHIANMGAWIHVEFIKGKVKKEQRYADCSLVRKNVIVIEIDHNLNNDIMLSTIAHEMVHGKQWLKGELGRRRGELTWKGKKVSNKLAYHETPWEVEAMRKEILMKHDFCEKAFK